MIARDMIVGLFSDWQCGSCGKGKEVGGKEERWGEGVRQNSGYGTVASRSTVRDGRIRPYRRRSRPPADTHVRTLF